MGSTEIIDFFLNYLKAASGGRCVLCEKEFVVPCEEKFEANKLIFHHVDERTKIDTISNLRKKGILYVLNELPKCVPLCISCHNRFTHSDEDETKIDHISRIKEYHLLYNKPGYLFGYPLNFIIALAIVHIETIKNRKKLMGRPLETEEDFTEGIT
ncbi:MAG: hypothetical protein WA631_15585, partial [Nitrososphaeraceae archaeon]